jgi:hypothetical protein
VADRSGPVDADDRVRARTEGAQRCLDLLGGHRRLRVASAPLHLGDVECVEPRRLGDILPVHEVVEVGGGMPAVLRVPVLEVEPVELRVDLREGRVDLLERAVRPVVRRDVGLVRLTIGLRSVGLPCIGGGIGGRTAIGGRRHVCVGARCVGVHAIGAAPRAVGRCRLRLRRGRAGGAAGGRGQERRFREHCSTSGDGSGTAGSRDLFGGRPV